MIKTYLDGKITEWETAEQDAPEASVSGSDAPKFAAFGNNHALFNAEADGLKSNAGSYHDSSPARGQRATAQNAVSRMQWILLSLLSGTALSACGGGGGGGGGAPVVKKPDPKPDQEGIPSTPVVKKPDPKPDQEGIPSTPVVKKPDLKPDQEGIPSTPVVKKPDPKPDQEGIPSTPVVKKPDPKPDQEGIPSTPVVKKPDPLPEELIKATPAPDKKETSEVSAEGEGEAPLDQKPTGLAFATPRGTAKETVAGTYTAAAGRKLSDIDITDDGKGVNRVFLKVVESHRYFEVKKNPATGTWELWLKGNMSLPDPGATFTAEIGINSDGFGNVAGVSARYILTVENTPEAPTVTQPTKQRGTIQETAPDETTSEDTTGIRFATRDEDGDAVSLTIQRQNAAGEWVAEARFEMRGNELWVKAGQKFDYDHADNLNGVIKLRVIAVDDSSEKLQSEPLEFEIRLSELPPSDPEDGGETEGGGVTPDTPETASSSSDWHYRIYENRPLDLPILKLPQRFIDSGFKLSGKYGDSGLFQLYGNKLMYVHKLGTGWRHLDYEKPADSDGDDNSDNIYELKFERQLSGGGSESFRMSLEVLDLKNETRHAGHARMQKNSDDSLKNKIEQIRKSFDSDSSLIEGGKPITDEELIFRIKKIIKSGYWMVPESGSLVLKWSIKMIDNLIKYAMDGNTPPTADASEYNLGEDGTSGDQAGEMHPYACGCAACSSGTFENQADAVGTSGDRAGTVQTAKIVADVRKYMAKAIAAIEKITNIRFVEIGDFDDVKADFTVGVYNILKRSDGTPDKKIGGKATFPFFNSVSNMWLKFKEGILENVSLSDNIFLHELGHLLGLKHPWDPTPNRPSTPAPTSDDKKEVNYTIMGYDKDVMILTKADIAALQFLYGKPGEAPAVDQEETRGTRQEPQPDDIADRKPSFFGFIKGGPDQVFGKKALFLVGVGDALQKQISFMIFDDGVGTNSVRLDISAPFLSISPFTGTGAFRFGTVAVDAGSISYRDTPYQYQLILDATGSGNLPASLTVEIRTFQVTGSVAKVGYAQTIEYGGAGNATFEWYLGTMLVSRSATFTPIEPGQYQAVMKIGDFSGVIYRHIYWDSAGEATIGYDGDDYLHAGSLTKRLDGGSGDDVLVAGTKQTRMDGGYSHNYDAETGEGTYSPDNDVFLVYRGLSRFADKAHVIADFTPTHDKIGLGYLVTEVWFKKTKKGIYLLNSDAPDALIYVFLAFQSDKSIPLWNLLLKKSDGLQSSYFDIMGQTVTLNEFNHEIRSKNGLHHWVVDNLNDSELVTLVNEFNKSLNPDRAFDRGHGRLIDLGDARKVWFDVQDVDGDGKQDTVLYKKQDRSEIYGVLDDYNGRIPEAGHSRVLDADFFVDNSIEVIDLDPPLAQIRGTGFAKSPLTAFKVTTEDATYQWFLANRVYPYTPMLVSESATFTPIEPGFYRLQFTINGQEGFTAKEIFWPNEGNKSSDGRGDETNNFINADNSGYTSLYGYGGDDYLRAGRFTTSLDGGSGDDVLVAGTKQTKMYGGQSYSYDAETGEGTYSPDNDVFLVYRGLSRFADKAHVIADFTPTHDKIGLGYLVTEVWFKKTKKGIYLLNSDAPDALIYVFLAFDDPFVPHGIRSLIIDNTVKLKSSHFDIMGQTVTLREFNHEIRTKNDLHHWVVDNLNDSELVTLVNEFSKYTDPDRASDREHGRLIDLGDARKVWFDVQDVDGDRDMDTILYKTEDRSEIYGVLDDYNGRVTDTWNRKLDADFFVDNTIEVIDLDALDALDASTFADML